MGYNRDHAIIITIGACDYGKDRLELISKFRDRVAAMEEKQTGGFPPLRLPVSEVLPIPINGGYVFFVGPDGSKEGWEGSALGDKLRDRIVALVDGIKPPLYASWALVQFYDDDDQLFVKRGED